MSVTLERQPLWSIKETAEILGLRGRTGWNKVVFQIERLRLKTKAMPGRSRGLDRSDIQTIAEDLEIEIAWPD
jgi:hypothetical protein